MVISRLTGQDTLASASTSSATATYASTPTQNNLILASAYSNVASGNNTITGWSTAFDLTIGNATASISLFYKIAGAGESTSVTLSATGATLTKVNAYEYTGNATSSVLDQTNNTNGGVTTKTTQSTNTITTTQADELLFTVNGTAVAVTVPSWDSSFNLRQQSASIRLFDGDRIVAATGTYSSNAAWTTSAKTTTAIASFKALVAATTTSNSNLMMMGV